MGYQSFFLWTIACGVPALVLMFFVRIPGASAKAETAGQAGGAPATSS